MAEALLDSTTYIDLEKANHHRRQGWAVETLRHRLEYRAAFGKPYISTVCVAEILRGLHRDINPNKAALFRQEVSNDFLVVDFDLPASFLAGEILARLQATGKAIGASDSLIAATAIDKGFTLVTSNTGHFQRIADLGYPLTLVF